MQDIVRHFVQRWNFTRADKDKTQLPVLLPHGPWPGYVPRPVGLHLLPGLMVDAGTQTSADDLTFGPPRPLPGVIAAPGATDAGATTAAYDVTGTAAAGTGAAGNGTGGTPPGAGGDGGHEPIHVLLHRWLQRARERKDKGLPPPKPTKPPAYPTADTKWYCTSDWTQQWCKSNVQILRSAGEWSLGTSTENSIYHSYLHAILNAEHFLYIENQYVISALGWTKEAMAELQIGERPVVFSARMNMNYLPFLDTRALILANCHIPRHFTCSRGPGGPPHHQRGGDGGAHELDPGRSGHEEGQAGTRWQD